VHGTATTITNGEPSERNSANGHTSDAPLPFDVPQSLVPSVSVVALLALALRIGSLLGSVDVPGDGPTRASAAYEWARNPEFVTHGFWPPGFLYLSGVANLVFPRPLYASRFVNLLLGTATVPAAFLAFRRIYGASIAFPASLVIALLPLHVSLSSSSLAECSAVFELLLGVYLLQLSTRAASPAGLVYLAGSSLLLSLASMTRYEIWPLLPALACYHWHQRRHLVSTLVFSASLSAFPLLWLAGNYLLEGNALLGLTFALAEQSKSSEPRLFALMRPFIRNLVSTIGPLFPIALVLGMILELLAILRGRSSSARILWLTIVLRPVVLSLPIAVLPVAPFLLRRTTRRLWLGSLLIVFLTVGLGTAAGSYYPRLFYSDSWVTTDRPTKISRLAQWLATSPWKDDPVLLSRMDWHSTYLALYYPPVSSRKFILSEWTSDDSVRGWVYAIRPALFVTSRTDHEYAQRFERIIGAPLNEETQVYANDDIVVFSIPRSKYDSSVPPPTVFP
jgi:hypothetical protein